MRGGLDGQHNTLTPSTALTIIAFGVIVAGLVYGRQFLLPLALAIFLWNLMEAMVQGFASVEIANFRAPRWLAALLGIATVGLGFYLIFTILLGQVDAINAAMPRYLSRFQAMVADLTEWLGPDRAAKGQGRFGKYRRHKKAPRPYRVDAIHHNHRPSDHRLHRVPLCGTGASGHKDRRYVFRQAKGRRSERTARGDLDERPAIHLVQDNRQRAYRCRMLCGLAFFRYRLRRNLGAFNFCTQLYTQHWLDRSCCVPLLAGAGAI